MVTHQVPVTRELSTQAGGKGLVLHGQYTSSDAQVVSHISLDLIRDGCRDLSLDLREAAMNSAALILLLLRPAHWMSRSAGRLRVLVVAGDDLEQLMSTLAINELVEVETVPPTMPPANQRGTEI